MATYLIRDFPLDTKTCEANVLGYKGSNPLDYSTIGPNSKDRKNVIINSVTLSLYAVGHYVRTPSSPRDIFPAAKSTKP